MTMFYGQDWDKKIQPLLSKVPNGVTHDCFIRPLHSSEVTVVDLRSNRDFDNEHITSAISAPLSVSTAATSSPFDDADTVQTQ